MAASGLKIDLRRKRILELLAQEGQVRVTELSRLLGTTAVTIRSDLRALEQEGHLDRIQGGAIGKTRVLPQQPEALAEKQAIAAAAAALIRDGDTLFINSGTTTHQLALALKGRRNLNVVTNAVSVAAELGHMATFRVILLGGELDPQYLYVSGGDAQEQLQKYQADYAFLSLDGVSIQRGITTHRADEAIIDRMMVERARKTVIVADHTKMGHAGFSLICPLSSVHTVVTDWGCDAETVRAFRAAGAQIIAAPAASADLK